MALTASKTIKNNEKQVETMLGGTMQGQQ